MNREQRRLLAAKAELLARPIARDMMDFDGRKLTPVTDAAAVNALTRAIILMFKSGGEPVAIPISEAEAAGFPRNKRAALTGSKSWLAVGLDVDRQVTFATYSIRGNHTAMAHEVAREMALAQLAHASAVSGYRSDLV